MSTEKRINASRANGAKSRGPRTNSGKSISSQNAVRHGMLARAVVLDDESKELFFELLVSLKAELLPRTGIERALVENMAVARWRQMRLWGMEKAGLVSEIRKQDSAIPGPSFSAPDQDATLPDAPTRAALAFRSLCDQSRYLELINRYESRYDRQYARTLERLLNLRDYKDRKKAFFSKGT
jgi:hypothetical protein